MQIFNANPVSPLRAWVHAILPLVYDDSLSYYEVLAKAADKMNEVVTHLNDVQEALHDNDEFLKNSIENLTQSFNNFQQSMLTRQENFETTWNEKYENFEQSLTEKENQFESKITEQQTTFESKINSDFSTLSAQLDGDIANWEADVQEGLTTWQGEQEQKEQTFESNMEQKFTKFLEQYQKTFGVVQTTGNSTTDVMSQKAVTDYTITNDYTLITLNNMAEKQADDLNLLKTGILHYDLDVIKSAKNIPDLSGTSSRLAATIITVPNAMYSNPNFHGFRVQMLFVASSDPDCAMFYRFGTGSVTWSNWIKTVGSNNVVQELGESTTDAVSQKAINDLGIFFKKGYRGTETVDCNDLKENGFYYVYYNAKNTNFPVINDDTFSPNFEGIIFNMNNSKYYGGNLDNSFINQFAIALPSKVGYENYKYVKIFYRLYHAPFNIESQDLWSNWTQIYPTITVQTTGNSTTDIMSQKAVTDYTITNDYTLITLNNMAEKQADDLNLLKTGILHYDLDVIKSAKNIPDLSGTSSRLAATIITVPNAMYSNPNFHGFRVQMLFVASSDPDCAMFYRFGTGSVTWSNWIKTVGSNNVVQELGESTTDAVSQKAINDLGIFFKKGYRGTETVDCNDLKENGFYYVYYNAKNTNFPVINDDTFSPNFEGIIFNMNNSKYYGGNLDNSFINQFAIALPSKVGYENYKYVKIFYRLYHAPFNIESQDLWSNWTQIYPTIPTLTSAYYYNMQYANLNGHTCVDKIALRKCKGHKIIIRGDSYAQRDKTWGNSIGSALEASSTEIIGEGGEKLTSMLSDLRIASFNDVKALFIEGGLNDCHQKVDFTTFKEAIETFCTSFKSEHPDIHVVFISPPKSWYTDESYERDNLAVYSAIMCNVAVKNGYSIVNGFDCPAGYCKSDLIDNLMPDNIHFGTEHYDIFAKTIISAII